MTEQEFEARAGEALRKLESALRDAADELEVDLADGILTLEFEDGSKFLLNSHGASQQIWLSANMGLPVWLGLSAIAFGAALALGSAALVLVASLAVVGALLSVERFPRNRD